MNWKVWLQGLAAAALGGAATGATQVVSTTGTVNKGTAIISGAGALVGVLAYLIKSPIQAGGAQVQVSVTPAALGAQPVEQPKQ